MDDKQKREFIYENLNLLNQSEDENPKKLYNILVTKRDQPLYPKFLKFAYELIISIKKQLAPPAQPAQPAPIPQSIIGEVIEIGSDSEDESNKASSSSNNNNELDALSEVELLKKYGDIKRELDPNGEMFLSQQSTSDSETIRTLPNSIPSLPVEAPRIVSPIPKEPNASRYSKWTTNGSSLTQNVNNNTSTATSSGMVGATPHHHVSTNRRQSEEDALSDTPTEDFLSVHEAMIEQQRSRAITKSNAEQPKPQRDAERGKAEVSATNRIENHRLKSSNNLSKTVPPKEPSKLVALNGNDKNVPKNGVRALNDHIPFLKSVWDPSKLATPPGRPNENGSVKNRTNETRPAALTAKAPSNRTTTTVDNLNAESDSVKERTNGTKSTPLTTNTSSNRTTSTIDKVNSQCDSVKQRATGAKSTEPTTKATSNQTKTTVENVNAQSDSVKERANGTKSVAQTKTATSNQPTATTVDNNKRKLDTLDGRLTQTNKLNIVGYDSSSSSSNVSNRTHAKSNGSASKKQKTNHENQSEKSSTAKSSSKPAPEKVADKPSNSSTHSKSNTSNSKEKLSDPQLIRKAIRSLNPSLEESDVRKLCREFVAKVKGTSIPNRVKCQSTQTDKCHSQPTNIVPNVSPSTSSTVPRKILHAKVKPIEKREMERERAGLEDTPSFRWPREPLPMRRKSIHESLAERELAIKEIEVEDNDSASVSHPRISSPSSSSSPSLTSSSSSASSKYAPSTSKVARTANDKTKRSSTSAKNVTHSSTAPVRGRVKRFNTDPQIYYSETKYQQHCLICKTKQTDKTIVSHYVKMHSDGEVYTSRFHPDSVERAKGEPLCPQYENTTQLATMTAFCYFCNKDRSFHPRDWPKHILSHTGEYQYECSNHDDIMKITNETYHRQQYHCQGAVKTFEYNFENRLLWAFMCKTCNYVQVLKKNIEKHLHHEHEFPVDNTSLFYVRIKLVSSGVCAPKVKKEIPDAEEDEHSSHEQSDDNMEWESSDSCDARRIKIEAVRTVAENYEIGCDDDAPTRMHSPCPDAAMDHEQSPNETQNETENETEHERENEICPSSSSMRTIKAEHSNASHHQSIVPAKTIAPTYHAKNGFMQAKNLSRADEDVYLEIIIPHYINNTENDLNITLNPWCELPGSVVDPLFGSEAQLREITLYALYKCMADHCIYSTNDPNQMLQHMKYHEIMVAIMISQNAELTKRQKSGWLHCAYCNHFADTSQQIVEHTGTTHGSSSFQCSLCFYRSAEIASLEQHQNIFHLNEDQKVLVCPSQPITLDAEHQTMLRNRSKVQKHFVCTQGPLGTSKFCTIEDFMDHIRVYKLDTYDCNLCENKVQAEIAWEHVRCHGLRLFHCFYCGMGCNDIDAGRAHISDCHPWKLLYLSMRKFRNAPQNTLMLDDVDATVIVDVAPSVHSDLRIEPCPYTEQQLNFMQPGLQRFIFNTSNRGNPARNDNPFNLDIAEIIRATRLERSNDIFLKCDDI